MRIDDPFTIFLPISIIRKHRWQNVEVIQEDAARYVFPSRTDGVLCTFALTLVPEYEAVIKNAAEALPPHKRLVILDFKKPEHWPLWLVKFGVLITKPFGVSLDLTERKPWIAMQKYFSRVKVTDLFGGAVYVAAGENGEAAGLQR